MNKEKKTSADASDKPADSGMTNEVSAGKKSPYQGSLVVPQSIHDVIYETVRKGKYIKLGLTILDAKVYSSLFSTLLTRFGVLFSASSPLRLFTSPLSTAQSQLHILLLY